MTLFAVFPASIVYAQLSVTFPGARMVFQRDNNNQTYLTITGSCPDPTDRVDVRLTANNPGQGQSTDWFILDANPRQGQFNGRLLATGGWYRLQVRSWRAGNVVATAEVQPVGVGEVFAIAGQSNGQGIRDHNAPNPADERVVCSPHFNLNDTIRLPLPFVAAPVSATDVIGPRGLTAWCWGRLGDRLAARLNVPVLFFNAAWSGTAVRNWRESITVDSTATSYGDYFRPGMPYGNLKRIVQDYAALTGLRAVLWHQGEAEFYDTDPSASHYAADLETVIRQCRRDAAFDLPWVVARASMDDNLYFNYHLTHYDPVISAQNQVIQTVNIVYPGPDTDVLQMPRPDGVHFSEDGLRLVGDAWYDSLTDDFFRTTNPRLPSSLSSTDLSLTAYAGSPSVPSGSAVRITMTVRNTGLSDATNVWLRCELPAPLTFLNGSGVSHKRGLVLAKVAQVAAGAFATVSFLTRPMQEGTYQLAAEIVRADQLDPDSRPNTSIGDGQDDLAQVSFRTHAAGSARFAVLVSVNADPLPAVASNQPVADPNKADISLNLRLSQLTLSVGQIATVNVVVQNQGGRSSGSVRVGGLLPSGLTFVDGVGVNGGGGAFSGTINDIAPGSSATLSFRAMAQTAGASVIRAQVEGASVPDPDSSPGNGYTHGEDDTAQATLRIR